jgi:hypothetical protein
VATDVLLGLLKGVAARRGADFRLLVMSATLDAEAFSRRGGAELCRCGPGREEAASLRVPSVLARALALVRVSSRACHRRARARRARRYFGGARAVWVQGRQHPVSVMCTTHPEDNYLDAALNAALQARGFVCCFLGVLRARVRLPAPAAALFLPSRFRGWAFSWCAGRALGGAGPEVMCTTHPEDNYLDAALNAALQARFGAF